MGKGGGHNRGQTMPYSSVRAFGEGKPMRAGHWSLSAAQHSVRDSLVAANARGLDLSAQIVDRTTGETVWEPAGCVVCAAAWATEVGPEGGEGWSRCRGCEDVLGELPAEVVPPSLEASAAPFLRKNSLPDADPSALLAALDRLKLPRAVWSDGTVAVVANGMLWTLQAEAHATTGTPCGVWSVASPIAVRGYFVPERAARFIRDRRSP